MNLGEDAIKNTIVQETCIPVLDLEESLSFYQKALRLSVDRRGDSYAMLSDPDSSQRICLKETHDLKRPVLNLRCQDFEKTRLNFRRHGGREIDVELGAEFKCATFKDPDGHEIFIWWEGGI